MGPFYESKKEREGHYAVKGMWECGTPFQGFVESQAQLDEDVKFSDGVIVVLGRVVGGRVVDQDTGRDLGPVDKVIKANWSD